ncbi:hypothetical protein ACSDQ9_11830 [Aestuariimicrobium soli]|uniref:hypothetical protein n=1 Tax=Aestuariimicrobium soli TaxID=2035834 RepID=UPI003EB78435
MARWVEVAYDFHHADIADVLEWIDAQPVGDPDDVWQVTALVGPEGRRTALPLLGFDPYDLL